MSFFIRKNKQRQANNNKKSATTSGTVSLPRKLTERVLSKRGGYSGGLGKRKNNNSSSSSGHHGNDGFRNSDNNNKKPKHDHLNEEITSEEDEEEEQRANNKLDTVADHQQFAVSEDDDDDDDADAAAETEQEARIRLAKETLQELKKKIRKKNRGDEGDEDEEDEHDGAKDSLLLSDALREQQLVKRGVVLRNICTPAWVDKELELRVVAKGGKVLKSPLSGMVVDTAAAAANNNNNNLTIFVSTKSGHVMRLQVDLNNESATTKDNKPACHVSINEPVTSLACSNTVVAVATPSSIKLLNSKTLELTHTFNTSSRNAISLVASGDTLYSTHKDRTVKLWNLKENAYVESLFGHQDAPTCIDVVVASSSSNSSEQQQQQQQEQRCVTTGGWDRTLRVWKIEQESQLVYNWDQDVIDVVKVLSPGYFVAGSCSGDLALFSFGRKKPLCVVKEAHGKDHNGVGRWITALGGQGDFVCSGSDDGLIKVWRVDAGTKKLEWVKDLGVGGEGVVVGLSVVVLGHDDDEDVVVRVLAGVSYEARNGRWGGKVGKRGCRVVMF